MTKTDKNDEDVMITLTPATTIGPSSPELRLMAFLTAPPTTQPDSSSTSTVPTVKGSQQIRKSGRKTRPLR